MSCKPRSTIRAVSVRTQRHLSALGVLLGAAALMPAAYALQAPTQAGTNTPTAAPDAGATGTQIPVQINGQATQIVQHLFAFPSPYEGTNSLLSRNETEMSMTYTLFLGARIRPKWDAYIDPEETAGKGISNALGAAGFPNGEVIRNPTISQEPYLGRYFLRYTTATGKGEQTVDAGVNQIGGTQPIHRLVVTAGKLGTNDIFDVSSYANSARTQFLNWALLNNGAYDYAADTRGYTRGVAVEWVNPTYALRAGSFEMPTVANGINYASDLADNRGDQVELELDPALLKGKKPFTVRILGYRNVADMGNYREAIALAQETDTVPGIVATRKPDTSKYGYGLNFEQALGDDGDTGIFGRYSWDNGATESFVYTEIDRAASLGGQLSGAHWNRPKDRIGLAYAHSDLSSAHRDYLADGGLGFLIGDGRLNYGSEQIVESYYAYQVIRPVTLSLDFQRIENPAYNRDRGPVSLVALRLHSEF